MAAGVVVSTAAAADLIEGTWNYQGGQVKVTQSGAAGHFVGTVTQPTKFDFCTHPVGQQMWDITGSADRYQGSHTWYEKREAPVQGDCEEKPGGQSTWLVTDTDPSTFTARFCTSK